MENGVSGGNLRHVGWNYNEVYAMGQGATGRTNSGAKGSEPIIVGWRNGRKGTAKRSHSVSATSPYLSHR